METNNVNSQIDLFGRKEQLTAKKFLANLDVPNVESALNYSNFRLICGALFPPDELEQHDWRIKDMFDMFDNDHDGALKEKEWKIFYEWLRMMVEPVNALVVVDMQNDFIDGSLALRDCRANQNGFDAVEPINRLIKHGFFDKIIYSLDWHPENHISFYENLHSRELHTDSKVTKEEAKLFDTVVFAKPYLEQTLWPKHCVMYSWGAQLHKDLVIVPGSEQVLKGKDPEKEVYSAFLEKDSSGSSELLKILRRSDVTHVFVCGVAYDICVKATCLSGLQLGYPLGVINDCCRGVDPDGIEATKQLILENDGIIIESDEALSLVNGEKRSLLMSHKSAKTLASTLVSNTIAAM
nr:uncharacterized protein LOC116430857 [Nomia melanderi]XP_031841354.1 uncharacterized protein LOC116430857 [Nomia melanderi]